MLRVRHCVECPKCRTRYLPGSSPYDNGSYLVPIAEGGLSGWTLYCSCTLQRSRSEWRWSELKPYEVCGVAYRRGYGSPNEVSPFERNTDVNRQIELNSVADPLPDNAQSNWKLSRPAPASAISCSFRFAIMETGNGS